MARKISPPLVLPEAAPYWQAANEGRLLIKRCRTCGLAHHYPRDICPHCLSDDTVWQDASGDGVLYSHSTMGQGDAAYTIAMVTLREGVTLMSNVLAPVGIALRVGAPVRVCFQPASNGQAVPMFSLLD